AVRGSWTAGNQHTVGPTALPVNAWTHLAGTFDGTTVRLYVNGVEVASQAQATSLVNTAETLQIGADKFAGENFAGRIDEVRIYNRALSPAEIQADMAVGVDGGGGPSGAPDTTPPTVAITLPAAGANVAGTVKVSATAADNIGLGSVWFLVDDAPLGPPIHAPGPYSVLWNAAGAAPGPHIVKAVAADVAGNTATSAPGTVTVPAPSGRGMQQGLWAGPVDW